MLILREVPMRRFIVIGVLAALAFSGCDFLDGPALMTKYLRNDYAESIFTIYVQIGAGDIQKVIDGQRLVAYATGAYQYQVASDEPTNVTILATSLGTQRTFSIDFDDPYSVTQTMVYDWDVATGGFVIWY